MTRLRLVIVDGPRMLDRVFTRFPVRIGRLAENECQVLDSTVSKVHARVEREGAELLFRDLGSTNGTILIEGSGRRLRNEAIRLPSDASFFLGHARLYAHVEHAAPQELSSDVIRALRSSHAELQGACAPHEVRLEEGGGPAMSRGILDALFRSLFRVRTALLASDEAEAEGFRDMPHRTEAIRALSTWTQIVGVALRHLERAQRADTDLRELRDTSSDGGVLGKDG